MNRALIGLISLSAIVASTPLVAAVAEMLPTAHVSTAGIDLTSNAGQAMMHRRIAQAAADVCGEADARRLGEVAQITRCRKLAVAGGERQLTVQSARAGTSRAGTIVVASLER